MSVMIFESEYWEVFLAEDQRYLGRTVIALKRKCPTLSLLTQEERIDFGGVVKVLESACTQAFGAVMYNRSCLMNEAYAHEHPDPQVHWHCRPRYNSDIEFDGHTFFDQEFGKHYEREKVLVGQGLKEKIAEEIKKFL